MDISKIDAALRKEAKSLFFAKVASDIRKARTERYPMRKKAELIQQYQKSLDRFNRISQKNNLPFGFLLWVEVNCARYWWMNALSGYSVPMDRIQKLRIVTNQITNQISPPFYTVPIELEIMNAKEYLKMVIPC